jgi:hypothetical protein
MRHLKPAILSLCLTALLVPSIASAQPPKRDSIWNGAFIGMAIGAAGPLIVCTSIGDSSETAGCVVSSLGFGGLSGFAIGALIDRALPRKVSVSPVVGRRTIGVQASLRLGRR